MSQKRLFAVRQLTTMRSFLESVSRGGIMGGIVNCAVIGAGAGRSPL
jgi:hypothetical protein